MTKETEAETESQTETGTETRAKAGAVIIPVTLFEQNCTLIWCEATKKAVEIGRASCRERVCVPV